MIPFVDLQAQYQSIKIEIDKAIQEILDTNRFIGGKPVTNFEEEFSKYCGKKYGIGVSSGTSAIYVAFKALDLKPGDEAITVANTFIASVAPITELGAEVNLVDIGEDHLIDVNQIEKAITKKTKVIMPVHLYGQIADMKPIFEIAQKHDLKVVEDCAQAHGAEQNNKKSPIGSIGCYSFYPGKNLGAYGDAGMILTDDEEIAKKASMYVNQGRAKGEKYTHSTIGSNYRLDSIQAAILSVKLKHLSKWVTQRQKNAELYDSLLNTVDTPIVNKNNKHAYHLYVIQSKNRDKLRDFLDKKGIKTGIHYPVPIHKQPAYNFSESFPVTERISSRILSLPMYPELTEEQISHVAEQISKFG